MAESMSLLSKLLHRAREYLRQSVGHGADLLAQARREFELGHTEQARQLCLRAVDDPRHPPGHVLRLLGLVHQRANCHAQAIECLLKAVGAAPANSSFHRDLALAYAAAGDHERAVASFEQFLRLGPADAILHNAIGEAFSCMKQPDKAEMHFRQALSLAPGWASAQSNLGKILLDLGRPDEAESLLRSALKAEPGQANTRNRLGTLLRSRGRYSEAEMQFRDAIRLEPNFADAYNNLGAVLNEQGRAGEAEAAFHSAIVHDPAHAIAWCNLGLILSDKGLHEQSEQCFRKAIEVDPGYFYARLTLVMNNLLEIYGDEDEIARSRAGYQRALQELWRVLPSDHQQVAAAAETVGWVTPFFLAYQGKNDRDLQAAYGNFVCSVMAKRYPELASPPPMPALEAGKPLRVGVVSGFFFDHSVWKTLIRGWIENLDRARFELHGYHTRPIRDAETDRARRACSEFVEDLPFEALACKIRNDCLHAVIFPEIGMDPATTKLATLRLAPLQCNSWGHPITSGMPTIDYYLSSELMEPERADHFYTEELIRLPNLSVHYTPPTYPARAMTRRDVGLRSEAIVFLCAQSLFKYLPQYDFVFPRIARHLDDSQFIFFSSQHSRELTEKFQKRVARAFEREGVDVARHLVMLPRVDNATFQGIARLGDIYLDSIEWSGCNTTLETMACAMPTITYKGSAMRGRHTYAFLKMMGLDELIAATIPSYIDLAIRLARDQRWRSQLRTQISARLPRICRDMACVRALEDFLWRSVARNQRKPQRALTSPPG